MSNIKGVTGTFKLPVRGGADPSGVLQGDPDRKGHGAVLEEVHLQDNLEARRPRT